MEGKRISFIRDIVLDEKSLERFDRMLKSFFSDVYYDYERKNKSESSERKCKDVLDEINGNANEIMSLSIHCKKRGANGTIAYARIDFKSHVEIIEPSMVTTYAFDNDKTSLAFEQKLKSEVEGFSRSLILYWVGKIFYLLFTYFLMCLLAFASKNVFGWDSTLDVAGAYIIGLFSSLFMYKKLRPSVWFRWGKMLNAYKLQEKIIWVIIVGLIISVASGLILRNIE